MMLVGLGAGAGPTASSVVGDIVDIARGLILPPLIRPADILRPYKRARMRAHEGGYYVRLLVTDRPGAFAAIAGRMAEENISLKSIVQRPPNAGLQKNTATDKPMPVVMITHDTTEAAIQKAFAKIEADGHVQEPPQMIRIEKL
jgi:homoserine dehydrogenase